MTIEQYNRPSGKHHKPYDLSHFKILIAEDFVFIANLLTSTLQEIGIGKVQSVFSGNKA